MDIETILYPPNTGICHLHNKAEMKRKTAAPNSCQNYMRSQLRISEGCPSSTGAHFIYKFKKQPGCIHLPQLKHIEAGVLHSHPGGNNNS
jgi:hypothetical protein